MSVDYAAKIVYGYPCDEILSEDDFQEPETYWDAIDEYFEPCNAYDDREGYGIIGDVVLSTETYNEIDFSNITVDTSEKNEKKIKDAYLLLTGRYAIGKPKMYLMRQVW